MNEKDEGKASRKQELKEEIRTIGTRSTWLLGVVVIVVLALSNFFFHGYGEDLKKFSSAWWTKFIIGAFFLYYFVITIIYIRPLIERTRNSTEGMTEAELEEKLNGLIKDFKALAYSFIIPLFFMFVFSVGLFIWWVQIG